LQKITQTEGAEVLEEQKIDGPPEFIFKTNKRRIIRADTIFYCNGIKLNNQYLKPTFEGVLDEKGFVKVNSFLQVEGFSNIFCIGDLANTKETKICLAGVRHAKIVANNIQALENNKSLSSYKGTPNVIAISLGRKNGASQLPFGVFGGTLTSLIKSKGLFISRTWKQLKCKLPSANAIHNM
jgi:NADH dehydrogenase FAD-containing subunit